MKACITRNVSEIRPFRNLSVGHCSYTYYTKKVSTFAEHFRHHFDYSKNNNSA